MSAALSVLMPFVVETLRSALAWYLVLDGPTPHLHVRRDRQGRRPLRRSPVTARG
jgi:hypothetical protein